MALSDGALGRCHEGDGILRHAGTLRLGCRGRGPHDEDRAAALHLNRDRASRDAGAKALLEPRLDGVQVEVVHIARDSHLEAHDLVVNGLDRDAGCQRAEGRLARSERSG